MKCCMVACINILSTKLVGGGWVGDFVFFTCFRPFGIDLQKFFSLKIFTTRTSVMMSYIVKFRESKFSV